MERLHVGAAEQTEVAIDPTARVHPGAVLAADVRIGPFCVVGAQVRLGEGTRLISHVVIDGDTVIGRQNVFFPFASVGLDPQDLKYAGEPTRLEIGDGNRVREGVTIHRGTAGGGGVTRIENECLLMAYSHVAHDCQLGSRVVVANGTALAGHVSVADQAVLGGLVGVHQFVRIGRHAFIGAGAMVAQDIPPFMMAVGDRARVIGVNTTGLERSGFSHEAISKIKSACRTLFLGHLKHQEAMEKVEAEAGFVPEVREVLEFMRSSERGVAR